MSPPNPPAPLCSALYLKRKTVIFFRRWALFFFPANTEQITRDTENNWGLCAKRALSLPLHCLHADWDRDQPSLPFKSHKTINLTSMDHPILLGSPDANSVSSSLDFTSRSTKDALPTPAHQLIVSDPKSLRRAGVLIKYRLVSGAGPSECSVCRASPQDVAANGVNGGGREEPPTMRNKGKEQAHASRKVTELIVTPISVPGTQRRHSRGALLLC